MDTKLFLLINNGMGHWLLDPLMLLLSSNWTWIFAGSVFFGWCYWKKSRSMWALFICLALAIILTDFCNYQFLKPFFNQLRPCQEPGLDVRLVAGCGGRLGFPSNHAANAAAVAVCLLLCAGRKYGLVAVVLAVFVGLSRVYLGVHYPGDILAGFVVGVGFGLLTYFACRPLSKYLNDSQEI